MISVIIATKNGEKYIARAVQSALSQSVALKNAGDSSQYPGFEVVVVSDGSTDSTVSIVTSLAKKDARIKLIVLDKNVGPGTARNIAILGGVINTDSDGNRQTVEPVSNKFVAILDDDDLWANPKKLENQITHLQEHANVVAVGAAKTEFTRENGEHLRFILNSTDINHIRSHMLSYNPMITSSVVFRTNVFKEVGGFKPMYLAEDYDLWLRMGTHGDISNTDDADTIYTIRDGGASKTKQIEMAWVVLGLAKEYRHQYPHFLRSYIKGWARLFLVYLKVFLKRLK